MFLVIFFFFLCFFFILYLGNTRCVRGVSEFDLIQMGELVGYDEEGKEEMSEEDGSRSGDDFVCREVSDSWSNLGVVVGLVELWDLKWI